MSESRFDDSWLKTFRGDVNPYMAGLVGEIDRLRAELREAEGAVMWLASNARHSLRGPHAAAIERIYMKRQGPRA